ncbi:hypothetical protein BCV70DRAFT_76694 [Testicularia cyperi]|uniref:Secreted protein n=1 Tax=Testicularia cyperi TaxID=1882483 RepID=A0A317XUT4_9BASI|nr:hypothetical protein BCV70DRAFT_76694 [Testicularia cyperi]
MMTHPVLWLLASVETQFPCPNICSADTLTAQIWVETSETVPRHTCADAPLHQSLTSVNICRSWVLTKVSRNSDFQVSYVCHTCGKSVAWLPSSFPLPSFLLGETGQQPRDSFGCEARYLECTALALPRMRPIFPFGS